MGCWPPSPEMFALALRKSSKCSVHHCASYLQALSVLFKRWTVCTAVSLSTSFFFVV